MPSSPDGQDSQGSLLGASDVRELASTLGIVPTKKLGQNFVIDPNTVRRICASADLQASDVVVEIGPGLGSLTLALLPQVQAVTAVEVDPALAGQLVATVAKFAPRQVSKLHVVHADAMTVTDLPLQPNKLVANLPYNISVPVVLHFLATFPMLSDFLVMVQAEVAQRMAAKPGSKIYGIPSLKLAWYADVTLAGSVGRNVFWPAPNVDSGLVRLVKHEKARGDEHLRHQVFSVIDSAFSQRRKTLRSTLVNILGSTHNVECVLEQAGVSSAARGEELTLDSFIEIVTSARALGFLV